MSGETYMELVRTLNEIVVLSRGKGLKAYELVEFLRSDDTKVNIEQMYVLY